MTRRTKRTEVVLTAACMSLCVLLAGCPLLEQFRLCGGAAGVPCPAGTYCLFEDGTCGDDDQTGLCVPTPQACTLEFAPVCGCDGVTYANECGAAAEGANVRSTGVCPEPGDGDDAGGLTDGEGEFCGGIAGVPCAEGQYCAYDVGTCGEGDQSGTCAPVPDACTEEFAPVCGCDGVTYGNVCSAAAAGVSIRSQGECPGEGGAAAGEACDGIQGLACAAGLYCNHDDGSCGAADQTGVCAAIPDVCTEEFAPVCGCDGVTYDNACFAAAAGVSVQAQGACPPSQGGAAGDACDGIQGLGCAAELYCNHDDGSCGAADQTGVCAAIPDVCTEEFAPVCGCDGVTYDNTCFAAVAGMSVQAQGSCNGGQ